MPNIERFTAVGSTFAEGLTDKEMNFGDKIQYPYSYPLEFTHQKSKFAEGLTDKEMNFGDKIQYPYSYPLEFSHR